MEGLNGARVPPPRRIQTEKARETQEECSRGASRATEYSRFHVLGFTSIFGWIFSTDACWLAGKDLKKRWRCAREPGGCNSHPP